MSCLWKFEKNVYEETFITRNKTEDDQQSKNTNLYLDLKFLSVNFIDKTYRSNLMCNLEGTQALVFFLVFCLNLIHISLRAFNMRFLAKKTL